MRDFPESPFSIINLQNKLGPHAVRPHRPFGWCCSVQTRFNHHVNLSPTRQGGTMPSSDSSDVSQWKQLCERAILELDGTKLPERIADARRAILDRAEE